MVGIARTVRFWGSLAVAWFAAVASAAPFQDPFAKCSERFARSPDDYDSAYCFYEVTQAGRLWAEGARVFEDLIAKHPKNFWLPLAYGHVYRSREPDRAEALYRRAADGFRAAGHAEGELLARSNLRNFLFPKGRVKDATLEMERVVEIGRAASDPLLKARAWTLEATHVQDVGGDLSHAYRLLKQTEAAIFPDGPYRLKRSTLNSLGLVAFRLGRFDEALSVFRKLDEIAAAAGEGLAQANAQSNILNTSTSMESLLPSPGGKARLVTLAERTLATAVAAQNRDVTLKTHRALAELLDTQGTERAKALEHVESCLALAIEMRQPADEATCAWVKASLLRETAPAEALKAELQALEATERSNSPRAQTYSASRRMRLSWKAKPRPDAIADALAAVDAIETLRRLQDDSDGTAELFSTWTSDYYWLSGRILEDPRDGDLDLAFSITERMRARSLLDAVERSRTATDPAHPSVKSRRALLEQIAAVQRRLLDPTMTEPDRKGTLEKLQALERQEQETQRQIAIAFPGQQDARRAFVSLQDAQATLAENEALLSFQVGLWETFDGDFGGGSWLVAVTRQGRSVHRLPDRAQLAPIVPVFSGLIGREDGLDASAAKRLSDDLLAAALAGLPAGIKRLIIVPDGPLHHLPFDALRSGPGRDVLAARYELVIVPSATLWRHWRKSAPRAATHRALAFADPELDVDLVVRARERNAALQQGLQVGRLPHARAESRALERHLDGVEALVGRRASEKALKERNLRDYDILHFAVHAIADEARPERSAVLLSAGADSEDGLLQPREIERLDLDGRIVVLSACQTATGAVLSGEGVLSLARAFFEAGAQSVIGSRWPIRDDDAASLFDAFYRRLGEGASLSEALTGAKSDAIARGRPAAAWASLVLLGDGDFRPFPGGRPERSGNRWQVTVLAVAIAVLALGAVLTARRRRSRR